ncbi:MAG: DUF4344 domain-containing metallopeptidase [Acidobacteriota bacterium]
MADKFTLIGLFAAKFSFSRVFYWHLKSVLLSRNKPSVEPYKMFAMHRNQLNLLLVLAILVLVCGCFCRSDRDTGSSTADPDTAQPVKAADNSESASKKKDNGDFQVEHLEVNTARYKEIDRQVKTDKLLEKAADKLNRALILPHDITLRTQDCSQVNAFYDPNDHSVTMCYELMEHFYKTFRSVGDNEDKAYSKMFDAVRFVFLHEIGHALIDTYKLPVTGNEEDSADRLSSFVNLKELGDEGVKAVFAAADAFAIESKQNTSGQRNLADEHLLQEQRFYNSLCMIYGSNTGKYSNIVSEGYLPKERAVRCPQEYQRTVESWVVLLGPWRKN